MMHIFIWTLTSPQKILWQKTTKRPLECLQNIYKAIPACIVLVDRASYAF